MAKGKGAGRGGCCCGACRSVPTKINAATAEVIEIQQKCCRCIPKNICFAVSIGEDTFYSFAHLGCVSDDGGDPIQYTGSITIDGELRQYKVRLSVRYDECYITWDIAALDWYGERLIDHSETADPYQCNHGQLTSACAQFGGIWEVGEYTISIAEPAVLEVVDLLGCGGCNCMCDCLCISVYSRNSAGVYTLYGTNEIVCSTITDRIEAGCGEADHFVFPKVATWESNGWTIRLGNQNEHPITTHIVHSGVEQTSPGCNTRAAVWKGDGFSHDISGATIDVEYRFDIDLNTALELKWVGRSHDENSVITFLAYNWVSEEWDFVASVDGRQDDVDINRALKANLEPEHTGTDDNDGLVYIRLTVAYGTDLITDMIRVVSDACCGFELAPPESVTLVDPPAKIVFGAETCPNPSAFWELLDTDDNEWFISANCSWCGSTCGTVATDCCPRPLGPTLFIEIALNCPTCAPAIIALPIQSGVTLGIWSGETQVCGQTLQASFSCSGGSWSLLLNLGTCTWSGTADSVECDPFSIDFSGTLSGGLGCCGPTGDPFATPTFSATVFE